MNYTIISKTVNNCVIAFTPESDVEKKLLLEIDDTTLLYHLQKALESNISKEAVVLGVEKEAKNSYKVTYQIAKGLGL